MTQTSTKFDRVAWLTELVSILDESQTIRERLEALNERIGRATMILSAGPAIQNLRAIETTIGNTVDNDLAAKAKELSKKSLTR